MVRKQDDTEVEDERALLDRLNQMREAGFRSTRERQEIYQDGLKYLYGNQLEGQTIKPGWDHIVVNYIFPSVMQELAYQTQRHQTVIANAVTRKSEAARERARVWKEHAQFLYKHQLKMPMLLLRAALDAKITGKFILYNYWDPHAEWDEDAQEWVGALANRLVRAQYVGVDPECGDDPLKGRYIITRRGIAIEEAVTRWPEYKEQLEAAKGAHDEKWFLHDIPLAAAPYDDTADQTISRDASDTSTRLASMLLSAYHQQASGQSGTPDGGGSQYVPLEQYWFKDSSIRTATGKEPIPEEELLEEGRIAPDPDPKRGGFVDAQTGEPMLHSNWPTQSTTRPIPEFPRGRFILRVGETILNKDRKDQVWRYRRWPFAFGYNQVLPHVSEGLNATEMAKNLQDRVNLAERHVMNIVKFFSDPVTYFEEGAFADGGLPVNRAGAARKLNKGGLKKINREQGVPITPGMMNVLANWKADLRDQTGGQEVGMGRRATGGKQTATETLALHTSTKLRPAMSNMLLDDAVITHFENLLEQGQRMYTTGYMVRVLGEKNADTIHEIKESDADVRLDVGLEVTTSLPFDQEKSKTEALAIYDRLGIPFLPQLLDAFDREDKDEILEAVQAWQMLQEQLAAKEEQEAGQPQQPAMAAP